MRVFPQSSLCMEIELWSVKYLIAVVQVHENYLQTSINNVLNPEPKEPINGLERYWRKKKPCLVRFLVKPFRRDINQFECNYKLFFVKCCAPIGKVPYSVLLEIGEFSIKFWRTTYVQLLAACLTLPVGDSNWCNIKQIVAERWPWWFLNTKKNWRFKASTLVLNTLSGTYQLLFFLFTTYDRCFPHLE